MSTGDSSRKAVVQQTPVAPPTNPQSTFDAQGFADAIADKGNKVYIERAVKCPCMVKASSTPLTTCQNCGGTGWFFIDMQQTYLLASSLNNKYKYETWSEHTAGTISISARAEDKLGFMDKVVFTEEEEWYSQILTVKRSTTNQYFVFTIYPPIQVYDIYLFVADNVPLQFVDPANYTIAGNKIIFDTTYTKNFANTTHQPDITCTIRYTHNPTYHILDMPRSLLKLKDQHTPDGQRIYYPVHCIGRKAEWIINAPNFNGDKLFDNTNYNRTPIDYGKA